MSSRNLLNLVLLGIIAVLVAVVIWQPGKKVVPVVKLTKLSKADINKITISRTGAKMIVLEKKGDNWRVTQPYKMPANNFKAEAITELAETKTKAHFPIKKGENLSRYGLTPPRVSVTFNDKVKLEFGNIETLRYLRYIREGNTLYLIFDRFFSNISNPPSEFVDHALLPGKPTITKLVLPKLTLTAQGDKWASQPHIKGLSNDRVNALLSDWTNAHAIDLHAYKPGKVKQKAELYIKGQSKPLVFDILRGKNSISLARPDIGLSYKFSKDIGESLLQLPPKINAKLPKPGTGKAGHASHKMPKQADKK